MEPDKKQQADEKRKAILEQFKKDHAEAEKKVSPLLLEFLVELGGEGERSAVVLGAERVNVALEELIKTFLRPSSTKHDELFSSDGALATFSRKIELAYRLGLIDLKFKQALNFVRKLRNDFAHATRVEFLEQQDHADKVKELRKLMEKGNGGVIEGFEEAFEEALAGELASMYLSCIMVLLVKLELTRYHLKRPDILLPAKIDYSEDDTD